MDRPSASHAEQELDGPHLDEDRALDLLLDLLPESELEAAGRHLAFCRRCEDLLRLRGAQLERRRASREPDFLPAPIGLPETSARFETVDVPEGPGVRRPDGGGARSTGRDESGPAWERPADLVRWIAGALRRPGYGLGLAFAFMAAAVLLLLNTNPRRTVIYPATAEWLPSAAETLNLRSGADHGEIADLTAALEAYDRRALREAIRALSAARASGATETLRLVFLGSSLAQAGEYRQAVSVLRSCPIATVPEPWRSETSWTLLVALHGAGEEAAADSLLRALADQSGGVGARARRLLGRAES